MCLCTSDQFNLVLPHREQSVHQHNNVVRDVLEGRHVSIRLLLSAHISDLVRLRAAREYPAEADGE